MFKINEGSVYYGLKCKMHVKIVFKSTLERVYILLWYAGTTDARAGMHKVRGPSLDGHSFILSSRPSSPSREARFPKKPEL